VCVCVLCMSVCVLCMSVSGLYEWVCVSYMSKRPWGLNCNYVGKLSDNSYEVVKQGKNFFKLIVLLGECFKLSTASCRFSKASLYVFLNRLALTFSLILISSSGNWGARWSSGQCARRAIAEAKQRSQWPVIGWVTKIYYLELLRVSEGTLSRPWSPCSDAK
jgi:hypothetical protein